MTIELNYWDMFWIGVTVGWILCWVLSKIVLAIKDSDLGMDSRVELKLPNYIEPQEFKYQPTQYFKHVPVKELRLGNQGEIPIKASSELPPLKKPKK